MEDNTNLIEIRGLKKYFPVQKGLLRKQVGSVKAVDDIHLNIRRGEIIGLVGESGCGKSTFGRCVLQIIKPTEGSVVFNGTELSALSKQEMRGMRKRLQMICQDPFSSLDPRQKAGNLIGEGLAIHKLASGFEYQSRIEELLDMDIDKQMARFGYDELVISFELGVPGDQIPNPDESVTRSLENVTSVAPFLELR